jgi:hypothetical protein
MDRKQLENLSQHRGQYNGCNITGAKFRSQDGTVSWKLTIWSSEGKCAGAHYWKTGGEFRHVSTHMLDPSVTRGTTFDTGPRVEPSSVELAAIEAAIQAWDVSNTMN